MLISVNGFQVLTAANFNIFTRTCNRYQCPVLHRYILVSFYPSQYENSMTKAKITIIMCLLATRSAREHSDLILLDKSAHLSETVIMVHDDRKQNADDE